MVGCRWHGWITCSTCAGCQKCRCCPPRKGFDVTPLFTESKAIVSALLLPLENTIRNLQEHMKLIVNRNPVQSCYCRCASSRPAQEPFPAPPAHPSLLRDPFRSCIRPLPAFKYPAVAFPNSPSHPLLPPHASCPVRCGRTALHVAARARIPTSK